MNVVKLHKRIDRGIKLLEAEFPGELAKLNADRVNMAGAQECVVALIAGKPETGADNWSWRSRPNYCEGIKRLGLTNKEARRHGFNLSDKRAIGDSQQWTLAWQSRIRELQNLATG